jgi:hypothetical protein
MQPIRSKYIAALAAALTLTLGIGSSAPAASASATPSAQIACKNATIGGQRKCIAAGQFCTRAYEHDYRKYGYSCSKRDANGRYHLKKR